jgi:hypothetical protein
VFDVGRSAFSPLPYQVGAIDPNRPRAGEQEQEQEVLAFTDPNKIDPLSLRDHDAFDNNRKEPMKKLMTYTMTALLATIALSIAAPEKEALMAKENAAWQAFKDKKADDFKKVVHADVVGVYAEGLSDMKKELADMQKSDVKSFAISDYKVVAVGADTLISTYTVTLVSTYEGKDSSGTFNSGSVWKKEKGGWMAIFHTNVAPARPAG